MSKRLLIGIWNLIKSLFLAKPVKLSFQPIRTIFRPLFIYLNVLYTALKRVEKKVIVSVLFV